MKSTKIGALFLLLICILTLVAMTAPTFGNAWLIMQTELNLKTKMEQYSFGSVGLFWSAVAGIACPYVGLAVAA